MRKKLFKMLAIGILFIGMQYTSLAQNEIVLGNVISLNSEILGEERFCSINLPLNYEASEQHYPVLYVLDGRTHFMHVTGTVSFLSNARLMPQMIVVAIHNVDRTRDFSPIPDNKRPNTGGGENFLKFLEKELIPHIEKNYRTSDFKAIMGHSFGGTFITYSLLEKPELFDAYLAVSPYLMYVDNHMVKEAGQKLKPKYKKQKYYYMTVGDEPNYFDALAEFSSFMEEKSKESIAFKYVKMKEDNHATTPFLTVYHGLRFVFSDWQLPDEKLEAGLDAVDEHYKKVSEKYGFQVGTPEALINRMGYTYMGKGEIQKAIEVFAENVKRFPLSANVYDSLGEAYENNKQYDLAKENYKKAYDLASVQKHPNEEIYKANYERMANK